MVYPCSLNSSNCDGLERRQMFGLIQSSLSFTEEKPSQIVDL